MFQLPDTWEETQLVLQAILLFYDCQPIVFVNGRPIDFPELCARMSTSLETFLRTGRADAWLVPVEIHGVHADWLTLTCGLVAHRSKDFVLRWNVRAIAQSPFWAINRPAVAAFFPHLIAQKNGIGQLDTLVWQQIWQQATVKFWHGNAFQQLVELRAFCEDKVLVNTRWTFREDSLVALLTPRQKEQWHSRELVTEMVTAVEPTLNVTGELVMAIAAISCYTTGHDTKATYFCIQCEKLYCEACSLQTVHAVHVFKRIIFQ